MDDASGKLADAPASAPDVTLDVAPHRSLGLGAGAMFVLLNIALVAATGACLAVSGLVLGVWPIAALDTVRDGAFADRWVLLAIALAVPLTVFGLLRLSWGAFAKAKVGRCADWMVLALGLSLALHMAATGQLAL